MNGDGVSTCIHCGQRVVLAYWQGDRKWLHVGGDQFCEMTEATPVLTETPEVLTGQVQFPETEGSS